MLVYAFNYSRVRDTWVPQPTKQSTKQARPGLHSSSVNQIHSVHSRTRTAITFAVRWSHQFRVNIPVIPTNSSSKLISASCARNEAPALLSFHCEEFFFMYNLFISSNLLHCSNYRPSDDYLFFSLCGCEHSLNGIAWRLYAITTILLGSVLEQLLHNTDI